MKIKRPIVEAQSAVENRKMRMECLEYAICPDCGGEIRSRSLIDKNTDVCIKCWVYFDSYARTYNLPGGKQ